MEAVADSGPLIHLSEIGCLQLLNLFNRLHVPNAVWNETVERDRLSESELSAATNVHRQAFSHDHVEQFIMKYKLLEDAEKYIGNLYSISSLFVTRAIANLAIEMLHTTTLKGST